MAPPALPAARPRPGILCSGSMTLDIVVRPVDREQWGTTTLVDSIDYHVGGNGANTAIAAARSGACVRLVGYVGSDSPASLLLEKLGQSGVDTALVRRLTTPTATSIVIVNSRGDRKFLHRLGASSEAFSEPLSFDAGVTAGMAHYHMASLFILPKLRAIAPVVLASARAAGLSTSLDTNWDAQGRWMRDLEPCLPHLDYLFMNEDEARMVTGSTDPAVAAHIVLARGVRVAVMKLGALGCAIYSDSTETRCPAYAVDVKDTTGAGDCFAGGFLTANLEGASTYDAGRFANAMAGRCVQALGATEGIPPRTEIEAWMASHG